MAGILVRWYCFVHVALTLVLRPVLDCEAELEALLGLAQ